MIGNKFTDLIKKYCCYELSTFHPLSKIRVLFYNTLRYTEIKYREALLAVTRFTLKGGKLELR